jgi:excisionase family DNA binding protein
LTGPSLDRLADDPASAIQLSRELRAALLTRCAAVQAALAAATLADVPRADDREASSTARLLTVEETAARLGISRHSVYASAAKWPFTVRVGRSLRFSESKLAAWIERRARLG